MDEFIVAITGASGAVLGVEVLRSIHELGAKSHLVVSRMAAATLRHETGLGPEDLYQWASCHYDDEDMFAPIASGSYVGVHVKAMVAVPCSMKTLSAIAHGYGQNLIARAADVVIKERKKLVLVTRETPLSPIHLRNMLTLSEIGVVISPPVPSFYQKPSTVEDIVRQMAGRILDQMGIPSPLTLRWGVDV